MHKTEQIIESKYTVEGPDERGRYKVTYPGGFDGGWFPRTSNVWGGDPIKEAVEKHIASLPKAPTVDDAYGALEVARRVTWRMSHPHNLLHERTILSKDEAIELMRLLKKVRS